MYREDQINCEVCEFRGKTEQHDCVGRRIEAAIKTERQRIVAAIEKVLEPKKGFLGIKAPVHEVFGHHLRDLADLLDEE